MTITEIYGKKLKFPIEVKISISYIAESDSNDFYGEGVTEEEAIDDMKETINDMYVYFKNQKEVVDMDQKNEILGLFEE